MRAEIGLIKPGLNPSKGNKPQILPFQFGLRCGAELVSVVQSSSALFENEKKK